MTFSADDALWKLSDIKSTVRRLTGRLSTNQLRDLELMKYINRFYQSEMPALLHLEDNKGIWRFDTMGGVSAYGIPSYVKSVEGPFLSDGHEIEVFTDPSEFAHQYPPQFASGESVGTGDGATTTFTGSLSKTTVSAEDITISDGVERLRAVGQLPVSGITRANSAVVTTEKAHGLATGDVVRLVRLTGGMQQLEDIQTAITVVSSTSFSLDGVDTTSTVDYTSYVAGGYVLPVSKAILVGDQGGSGSVTLSSGAYSATFNAAPSSGQAITASYGFSSEGQPQAVLQYGGELRLYPTPSRTYHIMVAVTERPRALVTETDGLKNNDWGELIAYGAARRILVESGQLEQASMYELRFRELIKQSRRKDIHNAQGSRAVPIF